MTRAPALLLAALLALGAPPGVAAEGAPPAPEASAATPTASPSPTSPSTDAATSAPPTDPTAVLDRLRAEIDAASARGVADTEMRARLAEALVQALTAGAREAAPVLGARSLAAARAAGTAAEIATALGDQATALDGVGRRDEAKDLRAEALALIERAPDAIPILDRITFYSNLSTAERRDGDGAAATAHALAAAELLLTTRLPYDDADRWTKTLLRFGREATQAKDAGARELRIAVVRYVSKAGTGEPASAFKVALDNAVAICGERPELARDLLLDTIRGPRFADWLAGHRVAFVERLDLAASKWGLTGALASSSEDGRRIRRPLLDLLEAAIDLLAGPDGSLPPEASALLRRALYTGSITHDTERAERAGLRAVALIEAQPTLDRAALADAYASLGEIYRDTRRWAEARVILGKTIEIARVTGDRTALRSALFSLASMEREIGTPATTVAAYGALLAELDPHGVEAEHAGAPLAAAMTRQLGVEAAHAWVARSIALEELGQSDEAEFGYRRSLEISKRAGDDATFAVNAVYLAQHYHHDGRLVEAVALAEDVAATVGRDAMPTMLLSVEAHVLVSEARALPPGTERSDLVRRATGLIEAAEARRAGVTGDIVAMERSDDLRLLADVERLAGRPERALAITETLLAGERAERPIRPARLSLLLLDRAVLAVEVGRPEAALPDLAEAEALTPVATGDALSAAARASILGLRSDALSRLGRGREALASAREAARLAQTVVTAADGGRFSSSEATRKTMSRIFQKAVRSAWRERP